MKKWFVILLVLMLTVTACGPATRSADANQPAVQAVSADLSAPTSTPSATAPKPTRTPTPVPPTETPIPAPTLEPTLEMFPVVTFTQDTNCRKGPGQRYYAVLTYAKGQTAQANARNEDGSWVSVQVPDKSDYCWVSASLLEGLGNVETLQVLEAQTLPKAPWEITILKEICGHPNTLMIQWSQIHDATGYRVYRDGALVDTNYAWDNTYYENPRASLDYFYAIEAFNQFGVSERIGIAINVCD